MHVYMSACGRREGCPDGVVGRERPRPGLQGLAPEFFACRPASNARLDANSNDDDDDDMNHDNNSDNNHNDSFNTSHYLHIMIN